MLLPFLNREETPDINTLNGMNTYRAETRERYETLPTNELELMVRSYESRGFVTRLLTSSKVSLEYEVACEMLKQRELKEVSKE